MEIHGDLPIKGKYLPLDEDFNRWWKVLNSLGVGGFLLFVACLGSGDHKYYCALLSLILFIWVMFSARYEFPSLVKSMQKSKNSEARIVAKLIVNEYLPLIKKPHLFLPYWLGILSLTFLAAYPWLVGKLYLYFPI